MKTTKYLLQIALYIVCVPLFGQKQVANVKQIPYADTLHGVIIQDNYHWMQNLKDPAVRKFIRQKNREAHKAWQKMRPIEKEFYSEVNSRKVLNAPNDTLFTKWNGNFTWFRKEQGKSILYVKKDRKEKETILFDSKKAFPEKKYKKYEIAGIVPSPNEKLVFSSAEKGSSVDSIAAHFVGRIVESGSDNSLADHLEGACQGLWLNDSTLVYSNLNQVYLHKLGHPQREDKLLYEEYLGVNFALRLIKSSSGRHIFVHADDPMFAEYYYINSDGQLKLIVKRSREHRPMVEHFGNDTVFYIMTYVDAPNGKVVAASIEHPNVQKLVVPESKLRLLGIRDAEEQPLIGLHGVGNYLLLENCDETRYGFTLVDKTTGEQKQITFDKPFYMTELINIDTLRRSFRFKYYAYLEPTAIYEYSCHDHKLTKIFEQQISNYNPDDYVGEVLYAYSPDELKIPFIFLHRNDLKKDGSAPVYVGYYGSFGEEDETRPFNPTMPAMLDYGFCFVFPLIRGAGGQFSSRHKAGCGVNKVNAAYDVETVVRHLIAEGYTSKGKVHLGGVSAGATITGIAINRWPDLFASARLEVPALDMLLDTVDINVDTDGFMAYEFGNVNDPVELRKVLEWAPYQNVKPQEYPPMLFIAGEKDENVECYETIKLVAKLQANKTNNRPLLMQIDRGGTHQEFSKPAKIIDTFAFFIAIEKGVIK